MSSANILKGMIFGREIYAIIKSELYEKTIVNADEGQLTQDDFI